MSRTKTCCETMAMVLGRAKPGDKLGLMIETLFRVRDGRARDTIALRFRKAPKGDPDKFAHSTLCEINYCPFCGTQAAGPGKIVAK